MTFFGSPLFWGIELIQFILMLVSAHGTYISHSNGHRHPSTHALWLVLAMVPLQWLLFNVGAFIVSGLMTGFVMAPISKVLIVKLWNIAGYDAFTGQRHKG